MARYSIDDIIALAQTIYGESSSESFEGMTAVGFVVLNRFLTNPSRFGRSIFAVCHQPLQFSCWNRADPNLYRITSGQVGDQGLLVAMEAALYVLAGRHKDVTLGADHYFATYITAPSWSKSMKKTVEIGNHIFFRS